MRRWVCKIALGKVLAEIGEKHDLSRFEEPCPQEALDAIASEIQKAPQLLRFAHEMRACKSIAAANRVIERVYDEADRSGVWCGI